MSDYEAVLQRLTRWVEEQPDKKVWTFLDDRGEFVEDYSYQELQAATDHLAEYLTSPHVPLKRGDRVLLVFFPGLDFTASLIACFKAGLIAVPVFPPDPRKLKKDLHHFVSIQKSCDATVALTNAQFNFVKRLEDIKNFFSNISWPTLKWIEIDDHLKKGKRKQPIANTQRVYPGPEIVSFLQYTSGSTSEPKGVMISHGNLAHNLTLITTDGKAIQSSVCVSWLPQYHDMGLIGTYLGILYAGGKGYFLSPISFLKDPLVWVRTLSKYGGTHSPSPNFAYALVVRKFKEQRHDPRYQHLQLHTAVSLINAAEPVDYRAIREFYATFSPFGLPGNCVHPTYGLAEHTVFVCSKGAVVLTVRKSALEQGRVEIVHESFLRYENGQMEGERPRIAADGTTVTADQEGDEDDEADYEDRHDLQRVVGCGYPGRVEAVTVKIVHPEQYTEMESLAVGEVWVNSPSKALGYWNRPELSADDFQAEIVLREGQEAMTYHQQRYLRTGDMGFTFKDELFICGRLKDMIIVGGANHYPQDIERTVEQSLADYLRAGCSAAFAMTAHTRHDHADGTTTTTADRGTEEVVYVAELKETVPAHGKKDVYETIVRRCREVVASEHGLSLRTVCLLTPRTVPKTTSGKIARSWCRRGLTEGTLSIVYRSDADHGHGGHHRHAAGEDSSASAASASAAAAAATGTNTKPGYHQVRPDDDEGIARNKPAGGGRPTGPVSMGPPLSESEVRALSIPEIKTKIETALCAVSQASPTPLSAPINPSQSLIALGLDSMTIVQFKGILENRFHCFVSDEFLFTNMANLVELSIAVQHGRLTDEQEQRCESAGPQASSAPQGNATDRPAGAHGPGAGRQAAAVVGGDSASRRRGARQPLCPWFTCCY